MVEPTPLKHIREIASFPQGSGWKFQKYLSCHHLAIITTLIVSNPIFGKNKEHLDLLQPIWDVPSRPNHSLTQTAFDFACVQVGLWPFIGTLAGTLVHVWQETWEDGAPHFIYGGFPKWMVYNAKPSKKWMIWGYPYFWKHPYKVVRLGGAKVTSAVYNYFWPTPSLGTNTNHGY